MKHKLAVPRLIWITLLVFGLAAPAFIAVSVPPASAHMPFNDFSFSRPLPSKQSPPLSKPAPLPPQKPGAVEVHVDRTAQVGTSRLALGVTHTHYSADSWNNPAAVASARQLLSASSVYQNQSLMGWGADNPEPSSGVYDWSTLDDRINLIRQTGGVPVVTLCGAPDWMKGGQPGHTDWSLLEVAPLPSHYADFAELARRAALRYPDVLHFQVWNEMKGFWNASLNRWDYEGYTTLYNQVYDALKSVNANIQVGGPYVVLDSGSSAQTMSDPSSVRGPWGVLDQRPLDVITHWLSNKHGADFLAVDAGTDNRDHIQPVGEFGATQKFADAIAWIHGQTSLPIWWAEWYCTPWGSSEYDHNHQNAVLGLSLLQFAANGVSVPLRWQPQGEGGVSYQGDTESIWSDTRSAGGGQAWPFYFTAKAFHDDFASGTALYSATSSSASVRVLASATKTLLINTTSGTVTVSLDGTLLRLVAYEVRVQ
ncbi:MAG: xylan 1,4-beta-xylosidase [Chloroflexia bacterium]